MAERQFGPYRLVRQVAVGGMAEIHLAMTKGIAGFEKYVALKMIHPNFAEDEQFIQMLVDEAKIAVQLTHGNIAQTFDLGRVGDTYYITMEYVDGADLYKILRRGSEIDHEMPVDVCAFIAKEIAAALDYAHRKKDHVGKPLGIVHRDVSPQNVLISYAGEVKLVDFGIAKATMKARQTAVGVIKGKYYYMSPEQAWGDPIDARSDIFSAGIVLYEMLTGQMLYLEEDLHKLLDMARKADIAPPSTLRRGIPPQLERIVMHALAKSKEERYQSAGDLASDLERFLHAYSPVFTAGKVAGLIRKIIGDPTTTPEPDIEIEVRDGALSTGTLTLRDEDLIHDKSEIRDENSVIFRVADLKPKEPAPPARPAVAPRPQGAAAGRLTRPADVAPSRPAPAPAAPAGKIPKIAPPPAKPRGPNQETNLLPQTGPVWEDTSDDDLENVGERTMIGAPPNMQGGFMMDNAAEDGLDATAISRTPETPPADDEEDGLGGGTLLSAASGPGLKTQDLEEGDLEDDDDAPTHDSSSEDGPTLQRDSTFPKKPTTTAKRPSAPPALAAKIHAPAVSELRKPRASRKTPAGGVAQQSATPPRGTGPNVLQQIVGSRPGDAMPAPVPSRRNNDDSNASTLPQQPSPVAGRSAPQPQAKAPSPAASRPTAIADAMSAESLEAAMHETVVDLGGKSLDPPPARQPAPSASGSMPVGPAQVQYNGYATDASGMPLGIPTPAAGTPTVPPGYPQPPQGFAGYPGQQQPPYPGYPMQQPVSPGALYQFQPAGAPPPQPMSLTGQLRLFEADALPDKYKLATGGKWIKLALAAVVAVAVAAGVTFLIMRALRDTAPTIGSVHVESAPAGADVYWDDIKVGKTPITVDNVPVDTSHVVRLEAPGHKSYKESVRMPKHGGEVQVTGLLEIITGKIRVVTTPDGAEIRINGEPRGRSPMTLSDIDMATAKTIELRLRDYEPYIQNLEWPPSGEIDIERKLTKSGGH